LGNKEEMDIVYSNLDPNKKGFITVDTLLTNYPKNSLMKNFLENLNENLLPTSEIITNKLKKLKSKILDDEESQKDIDWYIINKIQ
jgi:hypothetical protein